MAMDPMQQAEELAVAARGQVRFGPIPSWAVQTDYDPTLPAQRHEHSSHLLWSPQVHTELRKDHAQPAVRLETMQAVTHISQWRLRFDPQTQSVCIHWIRIRRGDQCIDQAQPERLKVLQREEGLDFQIVDGCHTLLLVVEDVRVG